MIKRLIILPLAMFVICFLISCAADKEGTEYSTAEENSSLSESTEPIESLKEQELEANAEDDSLPLMIYYNDTVYYLKESLFVISEEKLRSYDIADNYESIGTIDIFVHLNERPKVNNSCNFSGEKFELYKYSEDDTEFITALWDRVQIWETEDKHNQQ